MTRADLGFPISLEHLHRYRYVSELLRGKRVLDIAVREGYGAQILAETADTVVGLDVDAAVVKRAADKYRRPNLSFLAGSAASMPSARAGTFDGIIGFDLVKDSTNVPRLFSDVKRLLAPCGLFIVSAPGDTCEDNVFQAKTYTTEEFRNLLTSFFTHVHVMKQALFANSVIQGDARAPNNGRHGKDTPQYLMAIASDSPLQVFPESTCSEPVLALLYDKEKGLRALLEIRAYQDETIKRQERQLTESRQSLASLQEAFAWHESQIDSLKKARVYLEHTLAQLHESMESDRKALEWRRSQSESLERMIASRDEALEWRASQVQSCESQIKVVANHLKNVETELSMRIAGLTNQLEAIHASSGWKFVLRIRSIRSRLLRLLGRS